MRMCVAGHACLGVTNRQRLHSSLRRYQPLIQVAAVLEPRSLQQLQQQASVERMQALLAAASAP